MAIKWACPKCGAKPDKHGRDRCLDRAEACSWFLCECDDDGSDATHGTTFANVCPAARCYHCGWGGKFPIAPKGLQAWEKKALAAGWTMPKARAKELAK